MTELVAWTLLAFLLVSVFASLRIAGRVLTYGGSAILSAAMTVFGVISLFAAPDRLTLPVGLPLTGTHLRLDPLSGLFLALIGLGACGASLFAIGYGRHDRDASRVLAFYPAFLAALGFVVLADDAFSFLFGWEFMSLTSWALVMSDQKAPDTARAGFVYFVMAVFSGLTLLLVFGLITVPSTGYAFDAIRAHHPTGAAAAVALVLALIGAGSKAGLVPLHVWLPLAHPAAPTHVSALMSGVMTKVAVYAFIRIVFDLLGTPPWWTGTLVLVIGGVTATLGVLQALFERDIKRLLAFSTIENIGIIFIGLGLAVAFRANGFQAGAALALTAALFHALNHTVFKSLLFFGAGSVLSETGTRDMEALGGLIHRMPRTALAFLIGSAAIAGLPPLNGFASEWLTFQAILLRPELPQWGLKLAIPVDGALLALAVALASGCFVRLFGICFLGRPRSDAAGHAQEADNWSSGTMLGFAALSLLLGILPGIVIDALASVSILLTGSRIPIQIGNDWLTIAPISSYRSSYNGALIFAFIAISMVLTIAIVHYMSRAVRKGAAWDCGFPTATPATQYTAASFEQPIRRVFGSILLKADSVVEFPVPGDSRPAKIANRINDPVWDYAYARIGSAVGWISTQANRLQYLTIRRYLGFVFATLVMLLMALTLWQ